MAELSLPVNTMWIGVEVTDCPSFLIKLVERRIVLNFSVQLTFNSVTLYMY